jgi:hypothetical protein
MMSWNVTASGKSGDVRTSISKQFTAQALKAPADNSRASAASFIDGILATQGASTFLTVSASGVQGVRHPDGGSQNNVLISIVHQEGYQT